MSDKTWIPGKASWDAVTEERLGTWDDISGDDQIHQSEWRVIEAKIITAFVDELERRYASNTAERRIAPLTDAIKSILSEYPKP